MPLVTRNSTQGNLFKEATTPNWADGDLWSDTTLNKVKLNVGGVATDVGATSFSTSAVVSQSTTIGDYTTPSSATNGNGDTTSSEITGDGGTSGTYYSTFKVKANNANSFLCRATHINFYTYRNNTTEVMKHWDTDGTTVLHTSASYAESGTAGAWWNGGTDIDVSSWGITSGQYVGLVVTAGTNPRYLDYYADTGVYDSGNSGNNKAYARATLPSGPLLVDNSTATKYTSSSVTNPNYTVDMGSSLNLCAIALYWDSTNTTETEIKIQVSIDNSTWTDKRKITTSNLTNASWNYYRFNIAGGYRYVRVYGTGTSKILSTWEVKILTKTDAQIFNDLGILTISSSDTSLGPSGT